MIRRKVVPAWISAIMVFLIVCGVAFNINDMMRIANGAAQGNILNDIFSLLMALSALAYCFMGYGKKAAVFFRLFCVFATLSQLTLIYLLGNVFLTYSAGKVIYVISMLTFGACCILATVNDLGKTMSYTLGCIILASSFFAVFLSDTTYYMVQSFFDVVLCAVLCIMIYTKYTDKTNRDTK